MALSKQEFSDYIKQFNFRELFNDMGWNNDKTTQPIVVDNETYTLQAVGEKSGFKILLCNPQPNGLLPEYNTRKKIETKVTKLFQEHLIIFFDTKKTEQIWQLVVRQSGKPTKVTETRWHINQEPELLFQRAAGIFFELDEEDKITIVDVKNRVGENFHQNNEKVTKQFYDKFKKEHGSFLQFIKGISDKANQEWYASLMLNRLMFCYFIQKKGFLDNNKNYLRDKLNACISASLNKQADDKRMAERSRSQKFYSFYRDFLLVLFHKGLNEPSENGRRLSEVETEIGKIPYLNGGLFDEHELEKTHTGIDIDDKAFERLFDFFDQYEWHLDTSITATGKDINPDVIGYIFEKYINDRANMGAYYTKEDITDYISKNCILPYLFDETARSLRLRSGNGKEVDNSQSSKVAERSRSHETELWTMVKQSGDLYIYDAVKKGVAEPLPKEIEQGIKDVSKRAEWNKPATSTALSGRESTALSGRESTALSGQAVAERSRSLALPTEIWREVVDRRNRYTEVKNKIDKGEIKHINDFITYNLNIRQFAQDAVENTNDPEWLKHFYKALNSVTIIDPTCGSGAFLFAAMNILEPLYEACLQRMEIFVEEAKDENKYKHLSPDLQKSWKSINHEKSWFRQCLAQVNSPEHPNLQYFIYKSIILRNLYGVDIMKEAVEISKLRLFLKLVATVEADYRKPNLGLEPLPDIDFNIRAGNTLVGFATEAELDQSFVGVLDFDNSKERLKEKCDIVARAFERYKTIQLSGEAGNYAEFKTAKDNLNKRLKDLNHELNQLLHKEATAYKYEDWLQSHQPFHWFAEFYEIVQGNGGFDVIIGNPPYLEVRQIDYEPKDLKTYSSGAVHSMCIERSLQILNKQGNISMIVPLSIVCTQRMTMVQNILEKGRTTWYANYSWRPGKLFENVNRALTIFVSNSSAKQDVFTTKYLKWQSDTREEVFPTMNFINWSAVRNSFWVPKIGDKIEASILEKVLKSDSGIAYLLSSNSSNRIFYRTTGGLYWKIFTNFSPKFILKGKEGKSSRETSFTVKDKNQDIICVALLSSNVFWWWYTVTSNLRDLNPSDIQGFKFPSSILSDKKVLELGKKYLKDLEANSVMLTRIQKQTGETQTQSFKIAYSKSILDEIDSVLAEHYKFSSEELDFISNYDIKYRMGKELESEDEE